MGFQCLFIFGAQLSGPFTRLLSGQVDCGSLIRGTSFALAHEHAGECPIDTRFDMIDLETYAFTMKIEPGADCPPGIRVESWNFGLLTHDKVYQAFEPIGFGRLQKSAFDVSFPSLQFTSLFTDNFCLYLGIYDGKAFPKRFSFDGKSKVQVAYLASIEIGDSGMLSLPLKIARVEGNCSWMEVADIYREFSMRTKWYEKGLARQNARPDWIANVPLWLNSHWQINDVFEAQGGKPEVVLNRAREIRKLIKSDIPILLHWYEWDLLGYKDSDYANCSSGNVCGFDSHYPQYFPVRDGFAEAVQRLRDELNVFTVPYINGRLFDKSLPEWDAEKQVKESTVVLRDGRYVDENYGNDVHFAAMCPSTTYWQNLIAGVSNELTSFSVAGIYIDEVAAADPVACYNEEHNHAPGGGSSWTGGYNDMMDGVRSSVGSDKLIITESNVEQLIGSVDTFLTLVAYGDLDSLVPAFQYVYPGGVFVTAGAEFFQEDVLYGKGVGFIKKMMKMFMLGSQLGWMALGGRDNQRPPMDMLSVLRNPDNRHLLDSMMELIQLRSDIESFTSVFSRGNLVREISPYSYSWFAGLNILIIMCNPATDVESKIELNLNLSEFLGDVGPFETLERSGNDWITGDSDIVIDPFVKSLSAKPMSCSIVIVRPTLSLSLLQEQNSPPETEVA
jgi:hypothetical protein